ncbi:hypothetical protein MVEN_01865700 [Mycena venus]|uniref:DUF6535 domain-containing protein n=1 Tax=Mycena venus TaxID=2733690 RepID=A0A8H6XIU3_9AGAR|nr:hypothetical protein MVEN_01865700 [Mycena venus]
MANKGKDRQVTSDEAAAAKLWAVYVGEAERYDKALVESWKSDMKGLIIFAALFSAIVTAFLIESYKTLNSDSGDVTVDLLSQISLQLAAIANGSTFNMPPSKSFTPPVTSIVCNVLWLISLGLSLACALIATLVQQWAREVFHRIDMRPAPVTRARMFSYLYYGLKRFHMHTVIEVLPLLLHASLFAFFLGLIMFLIPVNLAMTIFAAALHLVVAAVYTVITLLPVLYLDCPYRTPLSVVCWQVLKIIKRAWPRLFGASSKAFSRIWSPRHRQPSDDEATGETVTEKNSSSNNGNMTGHYTDKELNPKEDTIIDAILHAATDVKTRQGMDRDALVWTLKSLTDGAELEPFVEALPELLWGPNGARLTYREHIRHLVQDPHLRLDNRIAALLDSCHTGVLPPVDRERRLITCYKAFWAIATLFYTAPSSSAPLSVAEGHVGVDFSDIYRRPIFNCSESDSKAFPYFVSAKAIMMWSTFSCINDILNAASPPITEVDKAERASFLHRLSDKFHPDWKINVDRPVIQWETAMKMFASFPSIILFQYIRTAASSNFMPYQWENTRDIIFPKDTESVQRPWFAYSLYSTDCLKAAAETWKKSATMPVVMEKPWIDEALMLTLLACWYPQTPHIPDVIIDVLNLLDHVQHEPYNWRGRLDRKLLPRFPASLAPPLVKRDSMTALCSLVSVYWGRLDKDDMETRMCILDALHANSSFSDDIQPSIIALVRRSLLGGMSRFTQKEQRSAKNTRRIFPGETEMPTYEIPDDILEWKSDDQTREEGRAWETRGRFITLVEFLQSFSSGSLPYKGVDTLQLLDPGSVNYGDIPSSIQIRLAECIEEIHKDGLSKILLQKIVKFRCWDVYAESVYSGRPWVDDSAVRHQIIQIFTSYMKELEWTPDPDRSLDILSRVQDILRGLNHKHKNPDVEGLQEIAGGSTSGPDSEFSSPSVNSNPSVYETETDRIENVENPVNPLDIV